MSKKLEDYIKIYPALNKDFCEKVRLELNSITWKQHEFYNSIDGTFTKISKDDELDISWDDIPSRIELTKKVSETISKYILEDLKASYYNRFSELTYIRFNRYEPKRLMAKHCDHIHDIFDGQRKGIPILSVVGLLNDDYEGGEFLMFDEEKKIELKQGDIMVFPSVFLYPHSVAPVTKGIRDTFVSWAW